MIISDIPAGTLLVERYRVDRKLNDGAAASVYLATDTRDDAVVALKILDPLRGADPIGRARFERELQVLSQLSHPSIARSMRLENHEDLDILVLEYIEGDTLRERMERGRFSVAEARTIALQLARALEVCHRAGIIHRDLKPENIILHPTRGPVILDFGTAWFSSAATLTRTGSVIGSPQYLAPESFRSAVSDTRADVYSLGVILFEMLTGRPVQLAGSLAEMAAIDLDREPPRVSTLRPEIRGDLDQIVARAVAPRAIDRFATAEELAIALERGRFRFGRALQARLPCAACSTPLIIELPICPGCGKEIAWDLSPGPYAVQLFDVPNLGRVMAWLGSRYRAAFSQRPALMESRLRHTPVPLAVGVSRVSADQLLAEAEELGCKGEVVRARAIIGARLQTAAATAKETWAASALHVLAVVTTALVLFPFHPSVHALFLLPPLYGLVGLVLATIYVRRPLLIVGREKPQLSRARWSSTIGRLLGSLKSERSRTLAAGAVARAAPVLLGETAGLSEDARRDVMEALDAAIRAAAELDTHAALLLARPRGQLAQEMEEMRSKAARGDPIADERLIALAKERDELTETAVAHDFAALRALDACRTITSVLSSRTEAFAAIEKELA